MSGEMEQRKGEYSVGEEIANAVAHGLGAAAAIVALTLMIVKAWPTLNGWQIAGIALYGGSLVLLFLCSTLYHSITHSGARAALKRMDHSAIFLLIAGTYTPFMLVTLRGPWGWSLFGVVWGFALVGIILKFRFAGRFNFVSTLIYLGMGWLVMIAIKPLVTALPRAGLAWLVAGGLCYSLGTIFYLREKMRYHHAIWHVFVLGGSVCHWIAVYGWVLPDGN